MAIPTVNVGTTTGLSNSGTGLTASHTIPAAVPVGALMLMELRTAANTGTISTPTGWTIAQGPSRATAAFSLISFYKVAVSADTGGSTSVSMSLQSSVAWRTGFCWVTLENKGVPLDTSTVNIDNASNTTVLVTSLTTSRDEEMLILFTALSSTSATLTQPTAPSAFTEDLDSGGVMIGHLGISVASAAGVGSATASTSATSITHLIAVKPQNPLTELLRDDFNDNSLAANWAPSTATGASQAEVNQQYEETPPSTPNTGIADINDVTWRDVTGSSVAVEVKQVHVGANAETTLMLQQDGSNEVMMMVSDGVLTMRREIAAVFSEGTLTYDAVVHRWWRISESGGNILWDTSPDGVIWTNRRSVAVPGFETDVQIYLRTYVYAANAAPGKAVWDNLNVVVTNSRYYRSINRVGSR
jgi:hypothetical protein